LTGDRSFDPDKKINGVLAEIQRRRAVEQAEYGDLERAVKEFDAAEKLEELPPTESKRIRNEIQTKAHLSHGKSLAADGKMEAAVREFQAALALDPSLQLEPEAEAKHSRLRSIRARARELYDKSKRVEAIEMLKNLWAVDPEISLDNELIVLTSPMKESPGQEDLLKYLGEAQEKAFVITPLGSWQWAARLPSVDAAVTEAMEGARKRYGGNEAFVYAKGNTVVVENRDLEEMQQLLKKGTK
jgi:tetratricopeptide (TPR) repeat protein